MIILQQPTTKTNAKMTLTDHIKRYFSTYLAIKSLNVTLNSISNY